MKSLYRYGLHDPDEMMNAITSSAVNKAPSPVCMFDVISNEYENTIHKYWSVVFWNTPNTYTVRFLYTEYKS